MGERSDERRRRKKKMGKMIGGGKGKKINCFDSTPSLFLVFRRIIRSREGRKIDRPDEERR